MTKTLVRSARQRSRLRVDNPDSALFPVRSEKSFIQWPSEQQIQQVSERLSQIQQVGISSEANGDYFRSGNLAYEIQEIIRATAELLKMSQRANR